MRIAKPISKTNSAAKELAKKNYEVDTTCPVSRKEYLYFPVKTQMTQSLRITVMDPPGAHENGFAVAFVDGHVEMIRGKLELTKCWKKM